ncbi:MAG: tetratricopeptide repeat protein [Burkholderiales bacterium]
MFSGSAMIKQRENTEELAAMLALAKQHEANAQWSEAEALLQVLLRANPNHIEAILHLCACLRQLGRVDEAIECLEHAVWLDDRLADAHLTLGNLALQRGSHDAALRSYERVLELSPAECGVQVLRAELLMYLGRQNEGIACLRRAIECDPSQDHLHGNLLLWLNFVPGLSREALLQEHRRWAADRAQTPRVESRMHSHTKDPERRLRVGYISPFLFRQPIGYFMEPVLSSHDDARFEIFVYSDTAYRDAATERMRSLNLHWRDCADWDDATLERMLLEDSIDILVDLTGHNTGGRLQVFARKPAPVQISYLGYLNTTGLAAMDYRMTDAVADPPGTEGYYSEKLLRLPGTQWCYRPDPATPPVTELPALTAGYVTFGSFHNFAKLNAAVFEAWASLLRALPESQLMVAGVPNGSPVDRLREMFEYFGVAAARLRIVSPQNYENYLRLYGEVDIALDSWPYNGATTTCDSLWMGVPVVTLAGDAGMSRSGVSLLRSAGLPEHIATSVADYVRIARELATDLQTLALLRRGLRDQFRASPIMDAKGFTEGVEDAYRSVWREWCKHPR